MTGTETWEWVGGLAPGQATFFGWVVGFFTLVGGALFNACLNRKRDDRLRQEERKVVAAGLLAELIGLKDRLDSPIQLLKNNDDPKTLVSPFLIPDLAHYVRLFPAMLPKLGLLGPESIGSVIAAYLAIEQHGDHLLQWGGTPHHDLKSHGQMIDVSSISEVAVATGEDLSLVLQKAINKLEPLVSDGR